jgi:hypothetical protein
MTNAGPCNIMAAMNVAPKRNWPRFSARELFLPVTLVAMGIVGDAHADDPRMSGDQIEALIEKLVSPNEAPQIKRSSGRLDSPTTVKYPEGYNHDAQEQVMAAWLKLREAGTQAFPYLNKHSNDKQYSFTKHSNLSVGEACALIVRCHLQPFRRSVVEAGDRVTEAYAFRPNYAQRHKLSDPVEGVKWWETHKDKTLLELQIEAIEWTIAWETNKPNRYHKRELAYLNEFLESARKASRPIPPYEPFNP